MKPEQMLATRVANWLQVNHPEIIYRFDLAADMPLPPHLAKRGKALHGKWSKGYPDLFIATCRGNYGGLYIELKATKKLAKSNHTARQGFVHQVLRSNGYKVEFTFGFEHTIEVIEGYLNYRQAIRHSPE